MRPQKVPVLRNKPLNPDEPDITVSAHSALSYTKMIGDMEAEEILRETEAYQSANLPSNKNQNYRYPQPQDRPHENANNTSSKFQKAHNQHNPPQTSQKIAIKKINQLQVQNPRLSQNGIQESTVYQQPYVAAIRNRLQSSLVPDVELGGNVFQSELKGQIVQEEPNYNNVSNQSQILENHLTDSNTSHFIEANFDDLMLSGKTGEPSKSDKDYVVNIKTTQQRKSSIKESKGKEVENVQQLHATAKHKSVKRNNGGQPQPSGQTLHPDEGKSPYTLTNSYFDSKDQPIKTQKNQKETNNASRKQDIPKAKSPSKTPLPLKQQRPKVVSPVDSEYSEGSSMMLDSHNNNIQKTLLDKVHNVSNVVHQLRHKSIQNANLIARRNEQNQSPAVHNYEFVNKINDLKQQILNLERNYVGQQEQSQPFRKKYGSERQRSNHEQEGQMEIIYKQHYKESPTRNHKTSNSIDSQASQEDEFNVLSIENPVINVIPHHSSSLQSLRKMSDQAFSAFGINYKKFKQTLVIHKYTDCVQFFVPERGLLINWEYSGKFYLGKCPTHPNQQFLQKQGEGNQIQPGVYIYKGEFSRGKKNGLGIINYNKGQKYQGEWKNDTFHGKGKLVTSSSRYYGEFFRGKKQGFGKELFNNGDSYQGEYDDGKFHGHGTYVWQNRTEYVGQFYNGVMQGSAEWRTYNGDTYSGQYSQNEKHGQGVYKCKNGKIYKGKFEHGQPASGKGFATRNTIPVQRQISFDGRYKDDEIDEFQSRRTQKQLRKQPNTRIVISSMGDIQTEKSRKGSNRNTYHGQLD